MGDRIVLGGDHRGVPLKRELARRLAEAGFEVSDLGPHGEGPVDYPDFAAPAARAVSEGEAPRAIVICGSGLGVMYTANRFPRVRAALVHDAPSAALARRHNDANVLALSGDRSDADTAWLIVRTWLETPFEGGRHASRIAKIDALTRTREDVLEGLAAADPELRRLLRREARREARELDLRPVANYVSDAVLGVLGSLLAQRSAAFGTSPLASEAESLARERALALFGAAGAEVRVPSLGQARRLLAPRAAQRALFVGAELADPAGSGRLDVAAVEARARAERPDVLVVEAEEFVRAVDFAALRGVADALGARLAVDLGGLAGLVAGGALPSPTPHADLVWAATDRTLRGPRGALVLFRAEHAGEIAEVLGRPLSMRPGAHEVAALAVALREATAPDFRDYAARACDNAGVLGEGLAARGLPVLSGGTDTHTVRLVLSGEEPDEVPMRLARAGLRGELRRDARRGPAVLELATAAVTTRGLDASALREVAEIAADLLASPADGAGAARARVAEVCRRFPLHAGRWSDAD